MHLIKIINDHILLLLLQNTTSSSYDFPISFSFNKLGKEGKEWEEGNIALGILNYWTNDTIAGLFKVWANISPFTLVSDYLFISTFPQEVQSSAGVNLLDEVMPD